MYFVHKYDINMFCYVVAVKLGRLQDELSLLAHDVKGNQSESVLRQTMKIYEKLGDTAAKLECYKFALGSYINMVRLVFYLLSYIQGVITILVVYWDFLWSPGNFWLSCTYFYQLNYRIYMMISYQTLAPLLIMFSLYKQNWVLQTGSIWCEGLASQSNNCYFK